MNDMDVTDVGKEEALLAWLDTFSDQIEALKTNKLSNLSNGAAIYDLLNYLIPSHFTRLSDISDNPNDSLGSINNLRKVIESIERFLSDFNHWDEDCSYLNLSAIAFASKNDDDDDDDDDDITEVISLLELVIFCAIKSPKKELVIHKIQNLDHDTMACLASIIKKMTKIFDIKPWERASEWSSPVKRRQTDFFEIQRREDIIRLKTNNERLRNDLLKSDTQCMELNKIIKSMKIRITNLIEEKEKVKEERNMPIKEAVDSVVTNVLEKGHARTQFVRPKSRRSINHHKSKKQKRKESLIIKHNKEIELRSKEEKKLREQLEILEDKVRKFDQLEKSIKQYKIQVKEAEMLENNEMIAMKNKLEEIHILKQQISKYKHAEMLENNEIIELKKKLEEIPILKQQISTYKQHIVEMEAEIKCNKVESDTKLDKKEKIHNDSENKKLEDENRSLKNRLQKTDERLREMGKTVKEKFIAKNKELDALKNENEKLKNDNEKLTFENNNIQQKWKSEKLKNKKLAASANNERKLMSRSWFNLALKHQRLVLSTNCSKSKRNSWLNQQREHTGLTSSYVRFK